MPRIAANADVYAASRVGIFFPANNNTPADGNLTGQCVTLEKWFSAEMADVPNPFAARGDARYVGINLVAQGLARAVPAGQQKRGDLVVYEYGQYGHIGVLLSGGRLFQQNANTAGAQRRVLADGTVVYSSTIVPVYSSLGGVAPKYYRLNSYTEEEQDVIIGNDQGWYDRMNRFHHQLVMNADLSDVVWQTVQGKSLSDVVLQWSDHPNADNLTHEQVVGEQAINDNWAQQIADRTSERDQANKALAQANSDKVLLQGTIDKLNEQIKDNPGNADLQAQLAAAQKALNDSNTNAAALKKQVDDLTAKLAAAGGDTELLNGFGLWLSKLIARLGLKK